MSRRKKGNKMLEMKLSSRYLLYVSWIVALISTFGSLIFSEVYKFVPCTLCWYQRIFMYPLAIILAIGILKKERDIKLYVLPFSILGILVSLYQNLLYAGIIPESLVPCTLGISCLTRYIKLFGFVDIPQLSLLSFTFITICMLLFKKKKA